MKATAGSTKNAQPPPLSKYGWDVLSPDIVVPSCGLSPRVRDQSETRHRYRQGGPRRRHALARLRLQKILTAAQLAPNAIQACFDRSHRKGRRGLHLDLLTAAMGMAAD
jgi:hypothetical protein